MKDPTNKIELIQAMLAARQEWGDLILKIPVDRMEEKVGAGAWSVKDIIAHVTEYDRILALGLALRLQKPPEIWLADIELDKFNDILHKQLVDRAAAGILIDSQRVFHELMSEVRAHSESFLFGAHHVDGVPYEVNPCKILKSESYGHYGDHIPDLRTWIKTVME